MGAALLFSFREARARKLSNDEVGVALLSRMLSKVEIIQLFIPEAPHHGWSTDQTYTYD
jgi:hypothetical protein